MAQNERMRIGIFCFRNDLRLHDNRALLTALDACDRLHLVYVFEDRLWRESAPIEYQHIGQGSY